MPSLAQKRLPAPVVYYDGWVVTNNWLKGGNSGRQQWLAARQNSDIPFAILLRFYPRTERLGDRSRTFLCLDWAIADTNGVTKSKEYSWRITVTRQTNKAPKYVGDELGSNPYHLLNFWGEKGWRNFSAHTDRWYRWDSNGNQLAEYEHYWCGFDGGQKLRTRIQLIDQHGNPASKKSKILKFRLPALSGS